MMTGTILEYRMVLYHSQEWDLFVSLGWITHTVDTAHMATMVRLAH